MLKHYIAAMLLGAAALSSVSSAQAQAGNVGPARAAAVHQCSVMAQRYPETTWSSTEFELYRACMAEHGQTE